MTSTALLNAHFKPEEQKATLCLLRFVLSSSLCGAVGIVAVSQLLDP